MNTRTLAMLKKLGLLSAVGAFVIGLAACNTVEGAGEDVERGGQEVQDWAD